MTNAIRQEYATLFRLGRKRSHEQEQRFMQIIRDDKMRAIRKGYGYQASEAYMTSNSYDR